jgi:hypothetical protein
VERFQKPVVSDEPIGAGPEFVPGRRDNSPDRFAAAAALSRLAGLHPTFHYEGGLHARVPTGQELACFEAWSSALDLMKDLPDGGRFERVSEGSEAAIRGARAVFARRFDSEVWMAAVDAGPEASVVAADGWRLDRQDRLGRLLVARLQRR